MKRVYVVVRRDLPGAHLTVQAVHAAIAATFAYGNPRRTHPHLVLCGDENEQELIEVFEELKEKSVPVCIYDEEDMKGQYTAMATGPLDENQRKAMRKFRLLK